ncbi:MAG: site-specific integrase [Acidobacteria bacterium]|nr:site-specific integrase [Acidobacteriota bacterium]
MHQALDPSLPFANAAEAWLNSRTMSPGSRARYISARTLHDLQQYVRALNRKFAAAALKDIHIGLLREYQQERAQTCGANKINQELGTLIRIMKRARAWNSELQDSYEPLLREQPEIPRAMTPEEQKNFLAVASSREEWRFVYYYSLLALATSASNCEMRGIRIGDVNLYSRILQIRPEHAKNRHRIRTIPLHDEAVWAATRLLERAQALGASAQHEYLMPFRMAPNQWDFSRPMSNSGIRRPWEAIRQAADVPWLRIHDLRHTAITRMAEAGVPIPVILSMAGHISTRMQQHYTAVSDYAKRCAVEATFSSGNYVVSAGKLEARDESPKHSIWPNARPAARRVASAGRKKARQDMPCTVVPKKALSS